MSSCTVEAVPTPYSDLKKHPLDNLNSVTHMALAPEHSLVQNSETKAGDSVVQIYDLETLISLPCHPPSCLRQVS